MRTYVHIHVCEAMIQEEIKRHCNGRGFNEELQKKRRQLRNALDSSMDLYESRKRNIMIRYVNDLGKILDFTDEETWGTLTAELRGIVVTYWNTRSDRSTNYTYFWKKVSSISKVRCQKVERPPLAFGRLSSRPGSWNRPTS